MFFFQQENVKLCQILSSYAMQHWQVTDTGFLVGTTVDPGVGGALNSHAGMGAPSGLVDYTDED